MRTTRSPVSIFLRLLNNPFGIATLPIFFVLAFLPCILRLLVSDMLVSNPFGVIGPALAGFWFAATAVEVRVNFGLLGGLMTTLLWSANWLMMAGDNCCLTTGSGR